MRVLPPTRRRLGFGTAAALFLAGLRRASGQAGPARRPVATAVTEVFGDGQRLTCLAIEYDRAVRSAWLSPSSFRVAGRTVQAVYAASAADPAAGAETGPFVIVALSADDTGAALREGGPGGMGDLPPRGMAPGSLQLGPPGPSARMPGPPRDFPTPVFRPATATAVQSEPILATDGTMVESGAAITTTQVRNLVADDFRQFEFHDPATGDVLPYNLFVPRGYDPARAYPLVLFMHDAGATGHDPSITLRQGLGAIVWARPAEQAKRPCFVLAPQYAGQIVDDRSDATSLLDTTVDLVADVARRFKVDRSRLYATGQSGGAMMSVAMAIRHPDLFAALFVVAGQWDPDKSRPLARQTQWIVVSEGDLRAFPGQNAMTAVYEQEGARVTRAVWNGRSTPAQFEAEVAQVAAAGAPINYVTLAKGTVVPPGGRDDGGGNHVNTWRIAYDIEGIRDWLFRQHR